MNRARSPLSVRPAEVGGAPYGVYVHWPFCRTKCDYCDFRSVAASLYPHEAMGGAYLAEWERLRPLFRDFSLVSVYFGGGTPSLMDPTTARSLLRRLIEDRLPAELEITLEANPGTVGEASLEAFREAGFNRLSLGVQSFDPGVLRFLGRRHTPEMAVAAFQAARKAGFERIGLDLMVGSAPSTLKTLRKDLDRVAFLEPDHLSLYLLTLESGTPLARSQREGERALLGEETQARHLRHAWERLRTLGYVQEEISNFARPGAWSVHNSLYWDGSAYLGLGPAAHSFLPKTGASPGKRWENPTRPEGYPILPFPSPSPGFTEELTDEDGVNETILTSLRRHRGISLIEFERRNGFPMTPRMVGRFESMVRRGWLIEEPEGRDRRFRPTEEGWLFLNDLILSLVTDRTP